MKRDVHFLVVMILIFILFAVLAWALFTSKDLSGQLDTVEREWIDSILPIIEGDMESEMSSNTGSHSYEVFFDDSLKRLFRFRQSLEEYVSKLEQNLTYWREIEKRVEAGQMSEMEMDALRRTGMLELTKTIHLFNATRTILVDLERRKDYAYLSLLFFLVILVFVFFLLYTYEARQVKELRREREIRRRMKLLTSRLIEQERTKLARELHDGAAQELALTRMMADRLSEGSLKTSLQASLQRSIEQIRMISYQLRPLWSKGRTPEDSLRELVAFIKSRYPLRINLTLHSENKREWNEELHRHFALIAQEALINIVRHAEAKNVWISFAPAKPQGWALTIQDDGVGLGESVEGMGRRGMRERAELIGAEIYWETAEQGGTKLRVICTNDSWKKGEVYEHRARRRS